MDRDQASLKLLAHFDRPKTLELPDFEWVNEVISDQPSTIPINPSPPPSGDAVIAVRQETKRGIAWVLQWAAGLAALAVAGTVLIEFALLVAAERNLVLAARAGVLEATLPRATYQSVTDVVERRLSSYPRMAEQLQLTLVQNGAPVERRFRQHDGDRFSITLSAPNSSVLPRWLRTVTFWRPDALIYAHADQHVPTRKLLRSAVL
jgi:hypothetical protein